MSRSVCVNAGKAFRTPDRASLETEESEVAFHCKNYFGRGERTCRINATVGRIKEGGVDQNEVLTSTGVIKKEKLDLEDGGGGEDRSRKANEQSVTIYCILSSFRDANKSPTETHAGIWTQR